MNKLGEFFQTRRSKRGLHKETVPFPPLSAEEEQEIKDKLGIEPTADLEATVRSTLRKIKQVEIEEQPTRDEEYEEIGTVRIKGMPDGDKFGTIRRKKKQEEEEEDWTGTVRIYSDPQAFFNDDRATSEDKTDDTDTTDDQYGTMRIRHDSSDEDEEVDKKEEKTDKKNNSRPKRKPFSKRVKKNEPQFVYRLVTNYFTNLFFRILVNEKNLCKYNLYLWPRNNSLRYIDLLKNGN
jgi:hypothetical protein